VSTPRVTVTMNGAELRIAEATDPLELWQGLRSFFLSRGRVAKTSATGYRYPETTNREVRAVADLLDRVERRFARDDLHGQADERKRWHEGRAEVDTLTANADTGAIYPANERFWTYYTKHLCVYLSAASEVQTRGDRAREAFAEAVEALPGTLGWAAEKTPEVVAGVIDGAAGVAEDLIETGGRVLGAGLEAAGNAGSKGLRALLGPFVVPVLIGGAALTLGVVVLPRLLVARAPRVA
jgi:hypothetical protein